MQNGHRSIKLASKIAADAFNTVSNNRLNDKACGWPERWQNIHTNTHKQCSDSNAAFGFWGKIFSKFSFKFQVV